MPVTPVSRGGLGEAGLVGPQPAADHPEARLQRGGVDPHALDGARRRALARADLGALEGRARWGWTRRAAGSGCPARSPRSCPRPRSAAACRSDGAAPRGSRPRCPRPRGRRCTAARRRARRGARRARAPPPSRRTARSVARANGAWPRGVGSMPRTRWCMIGLPTSTISSTSPVVDARRRRELRDQPPERLPDGPGHLARRRPAWSIAYETRLMRSSPNRICGFIDAGGGEHGPVQQVGEVPGDGRRADVHRHAEGAVAEAGPDGDHATARRGPPRSPPRSPASTAACSARVVARSVSSPLRPHSRSRASRTRTRSRRPARRGRAGPPPRSAAA